MIRLNDTQQYVSDMAVDWFWNSSSTLFQFDGRAGTGKSVVLNDIVQRLHLAPYQILPMAYTGQAAIVMRTKGLTGACTCHSGLFEPIQDIVIDKTTGKPLYDKQFNTPIVKWKFVPKDFSDTKISLIIIDEAWTVPKRFRKFIENTGIKTIVAGDSGQLPPIGDDPAYLVDGEIYHLTELMRQASNSPLIYLANRAREGLPIECGLYGNDVLVILDEDFDNDMISKSDIVLCCRNKTREKINNIVRRDILHKTTDYPSYGERLICRKNNWKMAVDGISLANGLVGTVIVPPSISKFSERELVIDFLPDLLVTPFKDLRVNYNYLNAPYGEVKDRIKNSVFEKGEFMEYAYASTVHLAQGSEYSCGTYIEEFLNGNIQNNLNYTAITRFRNKMIYVKHKSNLW